MKLIYNAIKCNHCGEILVSYHRHDFKMCSCEKVGVDGGTEYLKRIGEQQDMTELSQYDNIPYKEIRKFVHWGKNYTADNKLLPRTKWIPLENLETEHLETLIEMKLGSDFYKVMFIKELQYRMLDEEEI